MAFEFSETTALAVLLVANAVLLATAALAMIRIRRQMRRFERIWSSPTGTSLATSKTVGASRRPQPNRQLERRVTELQSVVRTLAKRQQPAVKSLDSNLPIENAVRMARHGASIDDLVRNCGLNIGEAQLMHKLHGKAKAQPQTH